jgi:thioredoxin 1
MSGNKPESITDDRFEELVSKSEGLVVVDFWATWCGPCLHMAPALEAFAGANAGAVKVYKLDVDDNAKTAQKFQIRSIPTLIFFRNGEPVDISIGAVSQSTLQKKLDALKQGQGAG